MLFKVSLISCLVKFEIGLVDDLFDFALLSIDENLAGCGGFCSAWVYMV